MYPPRVSVVIPTRNSEKYLKEALDSILGQTFTDFELLIVDDNSTDGTLDIIRGYEDARITVLKGPGKGLAAALNFAYREARGEFIARMDADDIADLTRLGKQVAFLDEHLDVGVCGTKFQQFMDGDAIHHHMEHVRYADMLMGCYIGHPTAMLRRQLFVENNLFYDESMRFSEDYDLWTRAIQITKLANVQEVLLRYRRHNESASIAHMDAMHRLDVGVKVRMIGYLVGGLSSADTEQVTAMLKGEAISEAARMDILVKLMASIKRTDLCSPLELASVFHQIKPLAKDDFIRLCRDIVSKIPIFVISFNHLTYLQASIAYFEKAGFKNIHIIDNASSYPPLIEYLRASPHKVHYMGINYKHTVLFDSLKFKEIVDSKYFVLTDPDVLPVEECPLDFLYVFFDVLLSHPAKNKIGFSLKLNDLPDHYELKENVLKWEGRFYEKLKNHGELTVYDAPVDTTFALYRPRAQWRTSDFFSAFRMGYPYEARHLPWYRDLSKLTDEEIYYRSLDQGSSNWNGTMSAEQLHKKYGTGVALDANSAQASESDALAAKGTFGDTFRRRRIGELRGYFLNGRWPLLNLQTIPGESICTTLYVFGKLPLMSKITDSRHHMYRVFGVLPVWKKEKEDIE
ncbi:glycosyltransferase family 2 protein [Variovorax sp. Root473]|uniref:glycosyltransferase family 2 protein n=1 Tax=Variovorax sp. Root473 TaxID=1736541 RepID=UPI0009EC2EDE|nr:glycosyltransferase [Variovorax sp. Root473]